MSTSAITIPDPHRPAQPALDLDADTDLPITARIALAALLTGTVVLLAIAALPGQRSGSGAFSASRPATIMVPVLHRTWMPSERPFDRHGPPAPVAGAPEVATLKAAVSAPGVGVGPTLPTGFTDDHHH
jgi:hypothetical protein